MINLSSLTKLRGKKICIPPKEYYCPLINNALCQYGGNKRYNYGFVSGMSSYCRLIKKWTHDMVICPKYLSGYTKEIKED